MRNFKTSASALTLGAILSTSLILGGCGEKNKGESVKIEKVATRTVNTGEAEQALKLMALTESGAGNFTWSARVGDSGNYTFSNLKAETKDGDKGIFGSLELKGVHMEDENAAFDQMIFKDFSATEDDGSTVTFANITLTEPSPALTAAITRAFNGDDDAFDNMEGDASFKALSFVDLKVDDEDGVFSMDSLKIGKSKDDTGYFSMHGLDMDMVSEGEKLIMTLGSFEAVGVNINKYQGLIKSAMDEAMDEGREVDADTMKELMDSMNAHDLDYKNFSLNNLNMNFAGLKLNLDSVNGKIEKKDGKVIMSQSMSPLTISPVAGTEDEDMKLFAEVLTSFGYDKLEFTLEQNSIIDEASETLVVTDSYIQMKDGFKLSYDLDVSGYKKFTEQAAAAQSGGSLLNPLAAIGMASSIEISQLRLALRDDSIIDRYFKMSAKENNTTPDALKNEIKDILGQISMEAQDEAQQKLADALRSSVTKFLDDGGTLVFEMNPVAPVNPGGVAMGAMFGSIPDIAAMDITISTE